MNGGLFMKNQNSLDKTQYYGVDFVKLFMAICVIAIHTSPLTKLTGTPIFTLYTLTVNQAVPFFFVASGYFLAEKSIGIFLSKQNSAVLKKFLFSIAKLYVLWLSLIHI